MSSRYRQVQFTSMLLARWLRYVYKAPWQPELCSQSRSAQLSVFWNANGTRAQKLILCLELNRRPPIMLLLSTTSLARCSKASPSTSAFTKISPVLSFHCYSALSSVPGIPSLGSEVVGQSGRQYKASQILQEKVGHPHGIVYLATCVLPLIYYMSFNVHPWLD